MIDAKEMCLDEVISKGDGIFLNMDEQVYRALPMFHYSMCKSLLRSPLHFKEGAKAESKYITMGSLFESMFYEGALGDNKKYAVQPLTYPAKEKGVDVEKKWSGNSKWCQQWKSEQEAAGKTVVTQDMGLNVVKQIRGLQSCKFAYDAMQWSFENQEYTQVVLIWEDPEYKVKCKAAIDILYNRQLLGEHVICDIKCTTNASSDFWKNHVNRMGYHIQAALYSDGYETLVGDGIRPDWFWICSEFDAPHAAAMYKCGANTMLAGKKAYKRAMRLWMKANESGQWNGYSDFPEEIEIANWALMQQLEEGDGEEGDW